MDWFPIDLPPLLWALIAIVASILYFSALIDAAKRPPRQWERAHMNKPLWIFGLLAFPWAGLFFYALSARPRLKSVSVVD
jgi:hypothetical protein